MSDEVFPPAVLTTERLALRPFTRADAADVHAVWQDERFIGSAPMGYPYAGADLDTAAAWCTTGIEQRRLHGKGIGFAVVPREGGRLVAHVSLFGADWVTRTAEIHYWTAPWARGHGFAAESAGAVARWALTAQRFERIALLADTSNTASRHVAASAGFRFEGVLRSAALTRTGDRADTAVYSLIRADLAPRPVAVA
ncbi:GNAT family N-acetyltransferase [Dactylosporangium roseum]|uniref:GNAT family N-acetyltransferase n=1 Tax=Dactylosporangium roseum TaxID=47989 RepID=A0ABY5YVM4_9ACTN|nr:GNAT family protein [Dactylosporangium roseum]UWZ33790.1 GNAT family N-acetyltransferase [Dactylosporangium roseum]